ncbi:hypothetical protein [Sporomusa sp.]|uniref:hypothetical protein n=1 Tax=Sporomusa sp. TaxID=2078658 RepID=UPI002BE5D7CB|nr:hypothetical protein [Sporomusa sp.]HWR42812.1 hypothetical protein [Sporomusa sp.]
MQRELAGLLGGIIGGVIKLVIDQTAFASNISKVDTVATFSLFAPGWFTYIIATGLVGWLVARLISQEYVVSYFSSGIILGAILWGVMNVFFIITGVATPTWSMGIGSFIVNLVSHLVLGVVIVYTVARTQIKVTE